MPGLLALLAKMEDPRHRRGVRYRLVAILAAALRYHARLPSRPLQTIMKC